jgi:hypothetical protein
LPAVFWLAKRSAQCPFFLIEHYFFIKIYMKEGHFHIGRRNFLKLGAAAALAAAGYAGLNLLIDNDLIPNPIPQKHNPIPADLAEELNAATATNTPFLPVAPTAEPSLSLSPIPSSEATAEAPNFLFGSKIDFFDYEKVVPQDQKPIEGLLKTRSNLKLAISQFKTTSIEEDFSAGKGLGKTWKDFRQYQGMNVVDYFLFLHSGRMLDGSLLQMTDIQEYLDKDPETSFRRDFRIPNQILQTDFIGSKIAFSQVDKGDVVGTILAAVRVPPLEVDNLFVAPDPQKPWKKVWKSDLLEYLAQKYPGFGFENVLDRNKNLVLITCGKNLNGGEAKVPDLPDYEQARYVFAITAN